MVFIGLYEFLNNNWGSKSPTVNVKDNDHNKVLAVDESGGGDKWIEMPTLTVGVGGLVLEG